MKTFRFTVEVKTDSDEFCNRTIMVEGLGGKIPNAGTTSFGMPRLKYLANLSNDASKIDVTATAASTIVPLMAVAAALLATRDGSRAKA